MNNEIREAVEFYDRENFLDTNPLLKPMVELSKRYLAQEGKMPEKKEVDECIKIAEETDYAIFANEHEGLNPINMADAGAFYMEGRNACLDDCQLAMVGMVKPLGVEDIVKVLKGYSVIRENFDEGGVINLAQAINQAMMGNK